MTDDELRAWLKEQCNALLYGHCETLGCYRRGGYDRKNPAHKALDFVPTCEARELDAIVAARKEPTT